MRSTFTGGARLALVGAVLLLPACGGDSNGPTTPTPTTMPAPPPPEVVAQGAGPILSEEAGFVRFTTTRAGRLDITVDWTFATNNIDILLVRGEPCTEEQFENLTCNVVAFSASETAKPERLTVPNAAAGVYALYGVNLGPGDESAALQVVLTPSASGAAAQGVQARPVGGFKRPLRGLHELR